MGEKDALLNPTTEMRNLKLEGISKRFRFTLQHVQEQIAAQLAKLEQELLLMVELSPIVSGRLKLRMQQLNAMADKLDRQTELSLDGEGWIAPGTYRL